MSDHGAVSLHGAFDAAAAAHPEKPALVCGDIRVSYAALASRAAVTADALAGEIERGELVGLCGTRSPGTIATLLGILRAGGAYVPVEPHLPDRRLHDTVAATGLRTLFASAVDVPRLRSLLPDRIRVLPVDERFGAVSAVPGAGCPAPSDPGALAYVMHTSGSSGLPRGVLVEHRSVLALVRGGVPGLDADQVILQLAPLHVDPSVFEIFGALVNGATLVLPEAVKPSIHDVGREVVRHGVTVLRLAAPLFRLAVEHVLPSLRGLRLFVSGGDRPDAKAVRRALEALPGCAVVNGYGPTETTVYACWQVMRKPEDYDPAWGDVPIGRPVAGSSAVVVDAHRRPVPPGEVGELCVAGPGVARGYLDGPASAFVDDPSLPGGRGYLTGDRVRQLPDGALTFHGRLDDQVKIRGFRVEPGEPERALLSHTAVLDAAVVVVREGAAGPRLAAFAVLSEREPAGTDEPDLRAHLAGLVPDHMIPATVTVLPALPTTPNGKTDRARLARTALRGVPTAPSLSTGPPPATGTEADIGRLWGEVLGSARIDPTASFFALGGDSLSAMAMLARLERDRGVVPSFASFLETPTVRHLATLLDRTVPGVRPQGARAPRSHRPGPLPLSPGQAGIWFDQQTGPGDRYNIARTFRVRGPLNRTALRVALRELSDRQQALRAVVVRGPEGWAQELTADPGAAVREVDLTGLPPDRQETELRGLFRQSAAFDPNDPPAAMVRTLLVRLGPGLSVVHFDVHHVIADDWSMDLFFEELSTLYAAHAEPGTRGRPPGPELTYREQLLAVTDRVGDRLDEACDFWRRRLDGWSGTVNFTTDFPRPALLSGRGDTVRAAFGSERGDRVTRAARHNGVSPFMLYVAAVYVVISQHTEQDDLCLGALATGRSRAGSDRLIGYFGNLLALRVRAGRHTPVAELLREVREACAAAYRHQDVPFHDVARRLELPTAVSGASPLPVVVNHRGAPPTPLRVAGAETTPADELGGPGEGSAKFEVGFFFAETPSGTRLEIEFSTDLYRRDVMQAVANQTLCVLDQLVAEGETILGDIDPEQTDACSPRVDAGGAHSVDSEGTLDELFARQAVARPAKAAAVGPDMSLTYGELHRLSDMAAARLVREGVCAGERVAICLDRSPALAVAILGVLKAGGAYVPLDPEYPVARLSFVLEDSQAIALISTKERAEGLSDAVPAAMRFLEVGGLTRPTDEEAPPSPTVPAGPTDPAYVIYTSGSTGRPRGAVIEHRSVVNTLRGNLDRYGLGDSDVWLQMTSPGFDVAVYEQLAPLVSGGTVVYCADAERTDPHRLTQLLRRHEVTVLVSVPSLLRALGRPDLAGVRMLVMAGEPADVHDTRHFARGRVVVNGYGPTEAAILATTYRAHPQDRYARVPIGTPLPGTTAVVVDRRGRPAATGVPGELYLGGAGVGRGYWNNPEHTRRLFTELPAAGAGRHYRTGDRARMLPDGNLDYLGRLDDQIKLRGFRIELGEIEAVLAMCHGVSEAAAAVTGSGPEAEILAFVVADAATAEAAREQLVRTLPGYMVPRAVLPVAEIPTNSHGKVDRERLARSAVQSPVPEGGAGELRGPLEQRVHALWQEVLSTRTRMSPNADFFASGGHSLRVVRLLGLLENAFGIRLGIREFLSAPTIRATARRMEDLLAADGSRTSDPVVARSDVRLDAALRFTTPAGPSAEDGPVLVTGATGFVGAHLLRELLDRTEEEVFCLVRAGSPEKGRDRLQAAAGRYGLDLAAYGTRLVAVPGDLVRPSLGMASGAWLRLSRRLRMVLHAGADVNHVAGYGQLAAANVGGTEEVLRLVAEGEGRVHLHHVSTLSVFRPRELARTVTEADAVEDERHTRGAGYAATKWAADMLVGQAVARAAPARIHRLGRAGGSTRDGATSLDDMLSRIAVSAARLGCYPDHPALAFDALPVDVMARAIVELCLAQFPAGTAHHVHQPHDTGLAEFMAGFDRRHATTTEPVPLQEWLVRLRSAADSGSDLPALVYREHLRELADGPVHQQPAVRFDNDATARALHRLGVVLPRPAADYVDRCWDWLDRAALPGSILRTSKDFT